MLDATKRHLTQHQLAAVNLASRFAASCSTAELREFVRKALASVPDFAVSDESAANEAERIQYVRGAARRAARDNRPLGRAYREDSRDWSGYVHGGDYEQYKAAYEEERAGIGDGL